MCVMEWAPDPVRIFILRALRMLDRAVCFSCQKTYPPGVLCLNLLWLPIAADKP